MELFYKVLEGFAFGFGCLFAIWLFSKIEAIVFNMKEMKKKNDRNRI